MIFATKKENVITSLWYFILPNYSDIIYHVNGIVWANRQLTSVTDIDGKFRLKVDNTPTVLLISYTGYNPEEVDVYELTNEDIAPSDIESIEILKLYDD
ncbi:hypothetical protein L6467_03705 [Segatella bryantii]|uniref:hypothetical protein n=1 Tax=Segatella bryantii TaxID=77095 RepID=UPI001EDB33C3|nr:hypothetical protein [Segatella bryantii]UKK72206.1 hypothetical protein L6467_03705 [Segatella bryantii]